MSQRETSKLVGRNLKRFREARGLTAEQVAQELSGELGKEVQPYIVNRIEKGARPISVDETAALARILDVRGMDILFTADDKEAAMRVAIKKYQSITYRAQLEVVSRLVEFMRQREALQTQIWFAEDQGLTLNMRDRNGYSEVDADAFWSAAEEKFMVESASHLDPDELRKRLGDLLDGPAS